ncbi:MAG: hypothetical protein FJ254_03870 [Phycisphaerae bacterium]|nr:hypothetical protein [Phycisphaerae bacterium]
MTGASLFQAVLASQDLSGVAETTDFRIVPEFWLFVAAGVLSVALAIGIAIFWRRISKDHDRDTR